MNKILVIFLLYPLFFIAQVKTEKYSKAKIYYQNQSDLTRLSANGIAVDHGKNKKNVFFESVFSVTELEIAKRLGFTTDILIDDMQKHIESLKNNHSIRNSTPCDATISNYTTPTNFNLGSMGGFLTLSEMLQELDDMQSLYPNLITAKSPISTFSTHEGRSIHWVKISDNPTIDETEPEILYTAIHHAREPASMQQLIYYMWYLLENYQTDAKIKAIVDNTEQYFVPIMNVDGYYYNETTNPIGGGLWRKNRRDNGDGTIGVDNNRNYGDHWNFAGTSGPAGETYAGTVAFSEVENQAIKWFTEQHHFEIAINNHTYSGLLLYPYGFAVDSPTPDHATFEAISGQMVAKNGYTNQLAADLYPVGGDSDDWMYEDTSTKNKIFAMTPEIGDSFWPSQTEIIPLCNKMLYHNITAAQLVTNYAKIEDVTATYISSLASNVSYELTRLGLQGSANFTVTLQPVSTNISSVGNMESHQSMTMLQVDTRNITLNLDASIQNGDEISYKLIIDNGSFLSEKIITKIYGTPQEIYSENGNNTNSFAANNWQTTTSEYYSANSSITDSSTGNYENGENNTLEFNNTIDLTNVISAKFTFYAKWEIEAGWDYVQFEISQDGGTTWIPQCGKYTKAGVNDQGIFGEPMYDGNQADWVKEEIDLSDYFGQQITYRFQLVSDNFVTEDGFYIDDLKVEAIRTSTASVENNILNSINIYPNPTNGLLQINASNNLDNLEIIIYALDGKLLLKKHLENNQNTIDISSFNNGLYFVNLVSNRNSKTIKIIKK